ncbi:MAG TPA: NUDIX domain-containing protein [Candidatus Aminicenantes bacterium]|nr:NUDIX domain-containing protein [Candidatus Aminicenantes bacterium]
MARPKLRNPIPAVDIIIEVRSGRRRGVVLVERRNPPPGWALPGGFVEYGESLEAAARREAREETSLEVDLLGQLGAYSDPARDPRFHTISTVFVARARGEPRGADDAKRAIVADPRDRARALAFDHRRVLDDYLALRKRPRPWLRTTTASRRRTTPTSPRRPASSGRSKRT